MALVACRECGNLVSTLAKSCPQCGAPFRQNTSGFLKGCLILFACLILMPACGGLLATALNLVTTSVPKVQKSEIPNVPQPVKQESLPAKRKVSAVPTTRPKASAASPPAKNTAIPKYEIVKSATHRYDHAPDYYVLVEGIDLNSTEYKSNVELVLRDCMKKKGHKVTLNVFDSREALNVSYSQYGDLSLHRPLAANEKELLARHFICTLTGQLPNNTSEYTLDYFPAAFTDHRVVGKHVGSSDFRP